ncbi:MAG TPA: DUF4864 domain-containing protein [Burkholderiales bacterium]|nr:DUF4864 domain-containing protein [Burkholderiales bacterium]
MVRALLLGIALLFPAVAQPAITADDLAEIRTVISRQIDAFRRDDAESAFALVSPAVQQTYGTPERFLDVMRTSYHPVYRPAAVTFLEPVMFGADAVQPVQLTDRFGGHWLAYYAMQRQKDGSWRTAGCHLVQRALTIPT